MNRCETLFLLLIFSFFAVSCDNFFDRYDPMEAGRYVFDLESFNFYLGLNSPPLFGDVYGKIDRDNREVLVTMPPSYDPTVFSLTADISVNNRGLNDDYYYYWQQINRNWYIDPKIKITKTFAGYFGTEENYYDLEYTVVSSKVLTSSVEAAGVDSWVDKYPYHYIFTSNPIMNVTFNDMVDYTTISGSDFNTSYPVQVLTAADSTSFSADPNPANSVPEGIHSIQLRGRSCEATTPGYYNEASNVYTFAYDAAAPFVNNPAIDRGGSNFSPSADEDTLLRISFEEASDSLTPAEDLEYKICYSSTVVDVTAITTMYYTWQYLPLGGSEWSTFKSPLAFNYYDLPSDFQALLVNSQHIYVNVIVRDNCMHESRASMYTSQDIQYLGP